MTKVAIRNLYVSDTDFYFDGNLRLEGDIEIENGSLIVTGNLVLGRTSNDRCSLTIKNGDLIAKSFWVEDCYGLITKKDDDLCNYFSIEGGDINITSGDFNIGQSNIFNVENIIINDGYLSCGDILSSYSIYVNGTICATSVKTLFDIYCFNACFYDDVHCGRDMYVETDCNLNENALFVKGQFEADYISHSGYIKIGK